MELIRKMWRDEDGQDVVEYALIAVLLAIASIATMTTLGTTISAQWTTITNKL
jgi:pilus assembly protein Flp/PilA